jgi:serine/threonine protein kinase
METQHKQGHGANGLQMALGGVLGDGRYELRGVLGRNSMSEVRDGWDLKLSRPVAIKLLYSGVDDPLLLETPIAAQPTGRHVVVVHDLGQHNGLPFIVMERLPGVSLADCMARGPLAPAFVEVVLDGVLDALAEAHGAGVLHRDIKPANILFTARGEAKLADFRVAKMLDVAYFTAEGMASKAATEADDLYAVGVVGYEALTGRRISTDESPPPVALLRPDVPPGLDAVIERAIARDPARRFSQADEMRAALIGS